MPLLSRSELRERVTRLAAIHRPSASPGERSAADAIGSELRDLGARVRVEEEVVHGTYWWPIGIATGVAALAGLARSRLAAVPAAAAALAATDDIRLGPRLLRALLPQRVAANVVAELGAEDAERTIMLVSHHDAAHTGFVFHPELPRAAARRFPRIHERTNTTPPTMWLAVGGPLLVTIGALLGLRRTRGLGALLSAGYALAMADVGRSVVVPGANDNLSGVAALLSVAHALEDHPVERTRVILLSTGSEESFSEGMEAFARRHFPALDPDRTHVICIDTVGSPELVLLEGEGMLGVRDYPADFKRVVHDCAEAARVRLRAGLRFRNATDGMTALRLGYPSAMIGSVDRYRFPTHYHWPTDTPENVDYGTVADAARLCEAVVRQLAGQPPSTSRT